MGVETALIAGAIAASAGSSLYAANRNSKAQREASAANERIASEQAAATEKLAQQANRQAPKLPGADVVRERQREGLSSTMLTGAGGVDPGMLSLGRQTLLGKL